jgi:peptidoglycan hydrolase-like protein with peptidoglycan-binding domain
LAGLAVLPATAIMPAAASAHRVSHRTLRQGMRGSDVSTLQRELSEAGFRTRVTGVFDAATARNVRSFERRYHLVADGVATPGFMRRLHRIRGFDVAAVDSPNGSGGGGLGAPPIKVSKKTTGTLPVFANGPGRKYGSRTLHRGMTGQDVEDLQDYLTLAGFPTGVDGAFGPKTRHSVVSFQEANGLSADGVITRSEAMTLQRDVSKAITASGSASQATLNSDGTVTAPANAPAAVQKAITAANSIIDTPYIYGGGHGSFQDSGYDCSGAVSFALHGGGLLSSPEDSTELETYGEAGPGKWITVYTDPEHAFVVIAGLAFDTAHYGKTFPRGSGARWLPASDVTANPSDGGNYVERHPAGL